MTTQNKYASIDFEFYDTAEKNLNLVCASVRHDGKTIGWWLHDRDSHRIPTGLNIGHSMMKDSLKRKLNTLNEEGYTFLAYAVTAEARCFLSLGLNPLDFKWVDLYLEYRCLSNHNDNYAYGKQLMKGKKKFTKRPVSKWKRQTEEDEKKAESAKQEYGMAAAVYKTLGKVIDTDRKKKMRDIIIACNSHSEEAIKALEENKEEIMEYCDSDVEYLYPMFREMINEYQRLLRSDFNVATLRSDIATRANYACRTAIMEASGYPIDFAKTKNFSNQVGNILWRCQSDINTQFTGSMGERIFRAKVRKRPLELTWNQEFTRDLIREWCGNNNYKRWMQTDTGKLSLSLKACSKPISFRHEYPSGHILAQLQRYLKLKQGLNGFKAKEDGKTKKFWDYVGRDARVRPYMGIYGAQSARSQPSATGFIPLKAAWMRSLIQPRRGRAICGIDFASQEFLLAALLSGDSGMLRSYESGDVYLSFGKSIGYIPPEGTKESHKKERDECKAVVLGLSYDMSEYGLAHDLSEKFGRQVLPEEALGWITKHKKAYKTFWRWKDKVQRDYRLKKNIRLPDGWYMWGDNDNFRSTGNFPVQGLGSCIMRKAVELAQEEGLDVIYTLHDALFIEYDSDDCALLCIRKLASCMDEAFRFYFRGSTKERATVRLDADVWSPDYIDGDDKFDVDYGTELGNFKMGVKKQCTYIDERALDDYKTFSPYFEEVNFGDYQF